ncbi:hypothetical protein BHYA_0161g00030 [Botrytis hyacinthi]|uniref:Uncharacterized protein n=1 Tax=Botrytis hyacinthi TaxID=278943 RepID=A0A4Z1GF63_9HELO|nr:hypothetical protein BHYA_0161g00030 [Botrytis hyacinthi]
MDCYNCTQYDFSRQKSEPPNITPPIIWYMFCFFSKTNMEEFGFHEDGVTVAPDPPQLEKISKWYCIEKQKRRMVKKYIYRSRGYIATASPRSLPLLIC